MPFYPPENNPKKVTERVNYDLDQNISSDDLVQETNLSDYRRNKLREELKRSKKKRPSVLNFLRHFLGRNSSPLGRQGRNIEECPLSSLTERNLKKAVLCPKTNITSNEENVRGKIVVMLCISFLSTLVISGLMTWFAATHPHTIDGQPIKDWTNTMMTTQVGFISAILGYYFGVIERAKNRKNNSDSEDL